MHREAVKVVYLMGADDISAEDIPEGAFVIYQVPTDALWMCGYVWIGG